MVALYAPAETAVLAQVVTKILSLGDPLDLTRVDISKGDGSPEGIVEGTKGDIYVDDTTPAIWQKATPWEDGPFGWILLSASDISALEAAVLALQLIVASLQAQVAVNTADITVLQAEVAILQSEFFDIRNYGASTASLDNTAAIVAAQAAAIAAGNGVVFVPQGDFRFASQLTNPTLVPYLCVGRLVFSGSGQDAWVWGTTAASTRAASTFPSVLSLARLTQDWTDNFAGLVFINVENLHATLNVQDFVTGVILRGDQHGTAYNQLTIQEIFGCLAAVRFHATGVGGFCNENILWGGRIGTLQATNTASPIHGLEFQCDTATSRPNGNKAIGTSIELHNVGAGYTSAIHGAFTVGTISANFNSFLELRIESTQFFVSGAGFRDNTISVTFANVFNEATALTILRGDLAADTLVLIQNTFDTNVITFGSSDPVRVGGYERANFVAVGASIWRPARGVVWNRATSSAANTTTGTLDADSVQINSTSGVGVILDFTNVDRDYQRFLTLKAEVRTTGGRIFCVCWDAAFTLLTSADDCSLGFNAGVGYYRTGSDLTADAAEANVSFGANVAYVLVGVASGTTQADISIFDAFALGAADIRPVEGTVLVNSLSAVAPSPAIAQVDHGDPISNAIPTVPGTLTFYPVGQWCRNVLGGPAVALGWVYTGSVWQEMPTTLNITGDANIGNAAFPSFAGNTFGSATTRRELVGTTTSTGTVAYDLFVNEGSRNPRCRFFLTDATAGSGAWGFTYNFGSAGLQPFVIAYTNEATAQLSLASGSGSSSSIRGGQATSTGTGGSLTFSGGPGGPSGGGGGGGALTCQGGLPIDGPGGDVIIAGRDAATTTAANRNGGNAILRAGDPTGTGTPGTIQFNDAVAENAIISPGALGATQDNWAPTGLSSCNVIRVTPAAGGTTLSGIVAGVSGRRIMLCNISATDSLTLAHDATSTNANRFLCPNNANLVIPPNGTREIWYDLTTARYRVIGAVA
jgi:hypothetical protein